MAVYNPTLILLLLILLLLLSVVYAASPGDEDLAALLGLKRSVTLDPSNFLFEWDTTTATTTTHHCEWHGVTCDGPYGRVVSLNLTSMPPLVGTLSPSVGELTELRVLSIPHNTFSGEIPPFSLSNLRLLEVLDLQGNNFSGPVPSLPPLLRHLNLSGNSFTGNTPTIGGLPHLQVLDLSRNRLTGKMLVSDSCPESLLHLRLSGNLLVDEIPPEIGNCSGLRSFLLDGNVLEGPVPPEIGRLSELRVLDVSRNSLTGKIPVELANCRRLSVLVLTYLAGGSSTEFNAFVGGIPPEILAIPSLEILWAPRANVDGQFPERWGGTSSCKLRVLNLGQNYLKGMVPEWLASCRNLEFLDLSSNELVGSFPRHLHVQCLRYLNMSRNSMSGALPRPAATADCTGGSGTMSDVVNEYHAALTRNLLASSPFGLVSDVDFVVLHDFSRNSFYGNLQSFALPATDDGRYSYQLLLNNNQFNGSLPLELFAGCRFLQSFSVDFSANQLSGEITTGMLSSCLQLKHLDAAYNQFNGKVPSDFGDQLEVLNLRGNNLSGSIPEKLGRLRVLGSLILGDNGLSGEIPTRLGEIASLTVLDLSRNALTGSIPSSLANISSLQVLLLDHNALSGTIPQSFSMLGSLDTLDVSFNNLFGEIPHLKHPSSCDLFKGNSFHPPCPNQDGQSLDAFPLVPTERRSAAQRGIAKSRIVAALVSASVVVSFLFVLVAVLVCHRRRRLLVRFPSIKRKVVVTFTTVPAELSYESVIKATANFSIRNLIGMGGFGSTYKAELGGGFLVAVKRLSVGRLQGLQQFDAEIRTLGRIRHKNLVTLIGYHMGEIDTFLIYNYLSGGNLEKFIHDRSGNSARWPVIHRIALDVAQALAYLHYSCAPRIVHRDIKPSNILLDEKLNAYLSDFGLARLLEVSETHATTDVAGTFGYVAPEYAATCRVTDKSDVYSYGVVLLEMMSGKRSLDPSFSGYGNGFNIVTWANLLIKEGRTSELFFPALWEAGPRDNLAEILNLASACTMEVLSARPSMKQVVNRLKQLKNY